MNPYIWDEMYPDLDITDHNSEEAYELGVSAGQVASSQAKAIKLAVLRGKREELANKLRIQFIPSHWQRLRNETNSWAKYVDRRIAELDKQIEDLTNNV